MKKIMKRRSMLYIWLQISIVTVYITVLLWNYSEEMFSQIIVLLFILVFGVLSFRRDTKTTKCKGSNCCDNVTGVKSSYINSLKGLAKQQRHDFMNFFQIVYGYLQLNKKDMAIQQIKKITNMSSSLSKVFRLSIPSISFLMAKKINDGDNCGVYITYNVNSQLKEELRDIENEEEIINTLETVLDAILEFYENIEEENSLVIDIEEYDEKINVIFQGDNLNYVFERLKMEYMDITTDEFGYLVSFDLEGIKNLKAEDNIYSKVLFN